VTFSQTDRNALVDVLNTQAMTWAQVLRVIAENQAFYNAEYNPAFVEMQYFGYLRRNPQDPPDNNFDGDNFWLNKLNQFGGDFRRRKWSRHFWSRVSIANASGHRNNHASVGRVRSRTQADPPRQPDETKGRCRPRQLTTPIFKRPRYGTPPIASTNSLLRDRTAVIVVNRKMNRWVHPPTA
jgi:hypothetical protein